MALDISNIQSFPNGLAIAWNDSKDSFIDYKVLREGCPCANCSGESDVFGNVYKGPEIKLVDNAFKLINATISAHKINMIKSVIGVNLVYFFGVDFGWYNFF